MKTKNGITLICIFAYLLICTFSCATCPPATPKNVQRWEDRHKFKAQAPTPRECDSLRHVKMLAMARKY